MKHLRPTISSPTHKPLSAQRRQFLKLLGATGASGIGLSTLAGFSAAAQTAPDYKALVCLFMFGGNDGNNLLVPMSDPQYGQYQRLRTGLALSRDSLLPLARGAAGGPALGLHPAMPGLQNLYNQGHAAMLANVGPLAVPTSLKQYNDRSVLLPENLFSHSDQQLQWQSALVDQPQRSGWAGRMMERQVDAATRNRGYSVISVAGGNLWEIGDATLLPYKVSASGNFGFDFYDPANPSDPLSKAISQTLAQRSPHLLEQAWTDVVVRSIDTQRVLTQALNSANLTTPFPDSDLGRQLRMIARLIAARAQLGLPRQCFFCSVGGFDTHGDDQMQRQNDLFGQISSAVSAFYAATEEMALAKQVALFSASDFGRTAQSNGKGSDHGWGNNHFVVGGAVKGGQLIGRMPEMALRGPDDVGNGIWLPTLATDQLSGTLGSWFGAGDALPNILPRLSGFAPNLGFMG